MSNELNVNEHTHSLTFVFDAKEGQKQECNVKYKVSARAGINVDMINETIKHFKFAVRLMVEGMFDRPETDYPQRTKWGDALEHGEPRVVIYSFGGFPLLLNKERGLTVQYDINVFNEFSTITGAILHASEFLGAIEGGDHYADLIIPTSTPPKPKSELDKHFGERQAGTPQAPATDTSHKPTNPANGIVDLGTYDYNQKTQYEAEHIGKVVSFNVSQVGRFIRAKKDGTGSFECLDVFGYYDGLPSDKHPIYDFRMFAPKEEQKFGDWKTFFEHIATGELSEPGNTITTPMRFYYKLSAGKGNNEGRVFWNLRKVEFMEAVATAATPTASEQQEALVVTDEGESIPF